MSTNTTERENPLLQIDTSFRTYLNLIRNIKSHIVDGVAAMLLSPTLP